VKDDDQRLIAECLQGRTEAFGELVRRYQDRLYNSVYRLVGNAEDAYDVVQDAFLNAYQSLGAFKGGSQFFTWMYRIAVNTGITLKRKRKAVLRLHAPGPDGEPAVDPADPSESNRPDYAAEMAEEEKKVHLALGRLTEEHRTVLVMKDLDGMKYEEIAEVLDVPVGTIRSRIHRARMELRQFLDSE
jgi:RNA polymerase sigma-70 factor, ECF subfamily